MSHFYESNDSYQVSYHSKTIIATQMVAPKHSRLKSLNLFMNSLFRIEFLRTSLLVKFLYKNKNIFGTDIFECTIHLMNLIIVSTQFLKIYISREKF